MPNTIRNLEGSMFGRLTVIGLARTEIKVLPSRVRRKNYWKCSCACGSYAEVSSRELIRGDTKSCGCLRREVTSMARVKHGRTDSDEYVAWCAMKQRCNYTEAPAYKDYGGRGVTICEAWTSFEQFLSDMGSKSSKLHSLDRIDNELGYSPENCRWATRREQARNTRRTVLLTLNGVSKSMPEWSESLGLSYYVLRSRLHRGWSDEKTLLTPVKGSKR